jgi:hypothetical protein
MFALKHVPQKYDRILEEALHIRIGDSWNQYSLPFKRRQDMIECMKYMIGRQ